MIIKKITIIIFLISILFAQSSFSKGKEIYKNCSICHGEYGEKRALGVSLPIKGRNIERVINELTGYKKNTLDIYGMGKIMFSIMPELSEEDIKNVSIYIQSMQKKKK